MHKSNDFKLCNSNYMVQSTENSKNSKRNIALDKDDYKFHNRLHKYILNSIYSANQVFLFKIFKSFIAEPSVDTNI